MPGPAPICAGPRTALPCAIWRPASALRGSVTELFGSDTAPCDPLYFTPLHSFTNQRRWAGKGVARGRLISGMFGTISDRFPQCISPPPCMLSLGCWVGRVGFVCVCVSVCVDGCVRPPARPSVRACVRARLFLAHRFNSHRFGRHQTIFPW